MAKSVIAPWREDRARIPTAQRRGRKNRASRVTSTKAWIDFVTLPPRSRAYAVRLPMIAST
jgi:hypothetical protein